MAWNKLVGAYAVLAGGVYVVSGGLLIGSAGSMTPAIAGLSVGYGLVGLLFVLTGGGIVMENSRARYLAVGLFTVDVVVRAIGIYQGNVVEGLMLVVSAGALLVMIFGDPFASAPRADMDEDATATRFSNIRR